MGVTVKRNYPLHIAKAGKQLESELPKLLEKVGKVLLKEVNRNLSGAVLNVRTGKLRSNVEQKITKTQTGASLSIGVKLNVVPYARIHELGGFAGRNRTTKIPKRPYLRRALVKKKSQVRKMIRKYVANIGRLK